MTAQTDLFDGLVEDVYSLTSRPDLELETNFAVRSATLSAHNGGAYLRDFITQGVLIPNAAYLTSLDVQVLFPRIRGLSSVQLLDTTGAPLIRPEIEVLELGDIRDPIYGNLKQDIAYMAGTSLNVRSSVPASGYLVGYYQTPLARRETFNSWIAQLAPEIIVYQAASIVFGTIGEPEKAKNYADMVRMTFKPQLDANFLTSALR